MPDKPVIPPPSSEIPKAPSAVPVEQGKAEEKSKPQEETKSSPQEAGVKTNKPRQPVISMSTIVLLLGLVLVMQLILFFSLGSTTQKQLTESAIIQRQMEDQVEAVRALQQYQPHVEQLTQSFPKEEGNKEFVQLIGDETSGYATSNLQISTNEPVKTPQLYAPFIPVSLTATATPSAFLSLVDRLDRSRYLLQPTFLEIHAAHGFQDSGVITYKGNLFISNELLKK